MRYLGIKSFEAIDRITIPEYQMRMKAYRYELIDKDRDMHYQAFLNFAVQSTTGTGKNIKAKYPSFDKFFDYQAKIDALEGKETTVIDERTERILEMQQKLNERR